MPPLKTSKSRDGQVIYHIDSEDEEPVDVPPPGSITASAGSVRIEDDSDVEEVTLLR